MVLPSNCPRNVFTKENAILNPGFPPNNPVSLCDDGSFDHEIVMSNSLISRIFGFDERIGISGPLGIIIPMKPFFVEVLKSTKSKSISHLNFIPTGCCKRVQKPAHPRYLAYVEVVDGSSGLPETVEELVAKWTFKTPK